MKLSWSERVFLAVNEHIGDHPWRDRLMYLSAHWFIYVLFFFGFVCMLVVSLPGSADTFKHFSLGVGASLVVGYAVSYFIAFLFPHDRPVREFPQIKELVHPMFLWKSFPSDHTISVTVLCVWLFLLQPIWWVTLLFVVGALFVAVGRVYVGVHYPRDILGGLTVGLVVAFLVAKVLGIG